MRKLILVSITAVAGLLVATHLISEKNRLTTSGEPGSNPGYFDQYFEMKKNENGEIPRSAWKEWMAHDKLSKKEESGVFSQVIEIGPGNIGGRTRTIVVDRLNPSRIYAGGISGGVWISEDNGSSWSQINDFAPTLSVSSMVQSPFDENILYYATGEAMGNSAAMPGAGIFKSTDRGASFDLLPASDTAIFNYVWRIEHSRTATGTIYVGTSGAGLFRSTDGGASFENIHKTTTEIRDLEAFDDSTIWYTLRGYGIYEYDERTGESRKLGGGLPTSNISYIDVDFCEAQQNIAYAVVIDATRNALSGIYKTVDKGNSWTKTATPTNVSFYQGWYDLVIEVDPENPDFVVAGAQTAGYTINGGTSWAKLANSHADYHVVTFMPNSDKYLVGNDGGLYMYDESTSATQYSNLNNGYNVTQYYAGYYFPEGNDIIGGTQDNGTNLNRNGSPVGIGVLGGDGAFCAVDQVNETVYASYQNAELRRKTNINTGNWSNIAFGLKSVIPNENDIWFINPFELNPVDGQQVYVITRNNVVRSTDAGNSWSLASDRFIGNGFSLGITSHDNPTIYVGGASGVLYRLENAKTAVETKMTALYPQSPNGAKGAFIGNVEINPQNESSIYLAMTNYSLMPRIWKVMNADKETQQWQNISSNLPPNLPVNWIEVDPNDSNVIMIGTDNGLYTSTNGGGWWQKDETIPNVKVNMIRLRESDRQLYIFTHGRGIWTARLKSSDQISGTREVAGNNIALQLYPNPVADILHLKSEGLVSYTILGTDGRTVMKGTEEIADVRHLVPGTYFIHVVTENGIAAKQFRKI